MKSGLDHIDPPWNHQQSTKHHQPSSLESMDTVSDPPSTVCLDQNKPQNVIENQCDDDSSIPSDDGIHLEDDSNVDPLSVDEVEEDCLMIGAPNIFTLLALTTRQFLDKHHHKFWFHLMVILGVHGVVNGVQSQFAPNGSHDDGHGMQSMNVAGRDLLGQPGDWRSRPFDPNNTESYQGFKFLAARQILDDEADQKFWRDIANAVRRGNLFDSIIIKGTIGANNVRSYDSTSSKSCPNATEWAFYLNDEHGIERIGLKRNCEKKGNVYEENIFMMESRSRPHEASMHYSGPLVSSFLIKEFLVTTKRAGSVPPAHAPTVGVPSGGGVSSGMVILLLSAAAFAFCLCCCGIIGILVWIAMR